MNNSDLYVMKGHEPKQNDLTSSEKEDVCQKRLFL